MSLVILLVFDSCNSAEENKSRPEKGLVPTETLISQGVRLNIYDFDGLKPLFHQNNDTLYIINFWATWCKPCVKELPYFEHIQNENTLLPVKVILVSLDFRPQLESQLIPFIIKSQLRSEVLVLDDPDADAWIEQVDTEWSGAIPATLFIRKDDREFYEKSFTFEELKEIVESKLIQI